LSDQRARLFVALELTEAVRDTLAQWRALMVAEGGGIRAVADENLHVTLAFLGWKGLEDLDGIAEACAVVRGRGALELSLGEAVVLPRRRPRVLAVSLADDTGALAATQSAVAEALAAGGFYEPEERPFLGHVTVARAGRGARIPRSAVVSEPPPRLPFRGAEVVLYRSHLRGAGASYEALVRIGLEPKGTSVSR
jgi:2'-5' RNA ligase